jgi:hypothetical protein
LVAQINVIALIFAVVIYIAERFLVAENCNTKLTALFNFLKAAGLDRFAGSCVFVTSIFLAGTAASDKEESQSKGC